MIKLKSLILEIASPYIVVGLVDNDLNVLSANNIDSHAALVYEKHPEWRNRSAYHWRFNGNDQTLYWYGEPKDEEVKSAVKDEIKKKYPHFHITKQKSISPSDRLYQKLQMKAHGMSESILDETMTYNDLMKNVDDGRKERSRQVRTRSIPVSVDENQESWNFRYKSNPSTTGEPFQGKITFFKEIKNGEDANNLPCKVDCGCPDFRYRFAYNDAAEDAADIGNKTLNKCINRKPQPAYDYGTGICKHLTALSSYLNTRIKNMKKSNLFEAMGEVAQQKNFEVPYYD